MSGKSSLKYGTIGKYDDIIIQLHKEGNSYYKIGKAIGFDPGSVRDRCKKLGLEFQAQDKVENHLAEILEMRERKISIREIARVLGFTHPSVSALLKKHNQSTDKTKYPLDETFFDVIDTEAKAYCLGLWMADGNIYKGRITLVMTDRDVIEKVKSLLKYEGKIHIIKPKKKKHKIKYGIAIDSIKLYRSIQKYGIFENKSLNLKFPNTNIIPNHLINHLVRGIHDGDGCLARYKTRNNWGIIFTGTIEVLQGIENVCGIKGQYEYIGQNDSNTWHWRIRKQTDIIRMLEWIYKDATIYMDRKKAKAEECLLDLKRRTQNDK